MKTGTTIKNNLTSETITTLVSEEGMLEWIRGKSMAQDMYFELSLFLKRNSTCMIVVPCRAHVIFFNNKWHLSVPAAGNTISQADHSWIALTNFCSVRSPIRCAQFASKKFRLSDKPSPIKRGGGSTSFHH